MGRIFFKFFNVSLPQRRGIVGMTKWSWKVKKEERWAKRKVVNPKRI